MINIEYYDSVCCLSVVFTSRWVGKFGISRDRRCQNFPMHREVNTADGKNTPWHNIPFIIYLIDLMLNENRRIRLVPIVFKNTNKT